MGVLGNNALVGASAAGGAGDAGFYSHQIANSIRADTNNGYLHITPSGAGNRATWTFSTWIKLAQMGTGTRIIYSAGSSGDQDGFYRLFYNANKLIVSSANANFLTPDNLFRDPSAWYNIVWKQGSNASTLYVNGSQIATASVSGNTAVNNNTLQCIGTSSFGGSPTNSEHLDGYFAETIMIDGTALDADSFGETKNGVWIPKDASGLTYGTNGFRLTYGDSSDLGNDSSGNNNDWTAVNLAVHDQMTDSPTFNSSSNGGNFATWNPLNAGSYTTLSEGNLQVTGTSSDASNPSGTFAMRSGKWYYEMLIKDYVSGYPYPGLTVLGNIANSSTTGGDIWAMRYRLDNGTVGANSGANITGLGTITTTSTGVATATDGDIISWYLDCDNRKAWIAKNGTIPNSGNPATGANPQWSWTTTPSNPITFTAQVYNGDDTILNAGQDGTFAGEKTAQGNSDDTGYGNFYYAPPTGFLAMCSGNLPISAQIDPAQNSDDYPQKTFTALAYNGDNGGSQTTGFQPDWVWVKARSTGQSNGLWDSTRGTTKILITNETDLEATSSGLTAFNSTGYTMGTYYNQSGNTYASWSWRANGGTTVTNGNGSEDSTVQTDPSGHFSIVKWTGTSDSWGNAITVGHGLNAAPDLIIGKKYLGNADEWQIFFSDYGDYSIGGSNAACNSLVLNNDSALYTNQLYKGFGGVMPTSTVFTVDGNNLNGSGDTVLAYCFANCEGYIKVGTYVGNANADGTFIYTGFEPAFILNKPLPAGNWRLVDNARSPYNVTQAALSPNNTNAEDTYASVNIDILSNGFKIRSSETPMNQATTYVYLAMAHNPFKYSLAR